MCVSEIERKIVEEQEREEEREIAHHLENAEDLRPLLGMEAPANTTRTHLHITPSHQTDKNKKLNE